MPATGLSLALLMFTGYLMNLLLPPAGISTPISTLPLTIVIGVIVVALCVIAYRRSRGFTLPHLHLKSLFSAPALFLILIPVLAILGTLLVSSYNFSAITLLAIGLIALVPLFVGWGRFIPKQLWPLAVVLLSLALLYHRSLLSSHLIGADIQSEYFYASRVLANSWWDSSFPTRIGEWSLASRFRPCIPEIRSHSLCRW